MLRRFVGLITLTTINILLTNSAIFAKTIRIRTITSGNYTYTMYVNTGNPNAKPRYFQIIRAYPANYSGRTRYEKITYVVKCNAYQMSNGVKTEELDSKKRTISLRTSDSVDYNIPTPQSFEELALQITCKTR